MSKEKIKETMNSQRLNQCKIKSRIKIKLIKSSSKEIRFHLTNKESQEVNVSKGRKTIDLQKLKLWFAIVKEL